LKGCCPNLLPSHHRQSSVSGSNFDGRTIRSRTKETVQTQLFMRPSSSCARTPKKNDNLTFRAILLFHRSIPLTIASLILVCPCIERVFWCVGRLARTPQKKETNTAVQIRALTQMVSHTGYQGQTRTTGGRHHSVARDSIRQDQVLACINVC
jgi:hypothetical protein